jgi:hypothetical protein
MTGRGDRSDCAHRWNFATSSDATGSPVQVRAIDLDLKRRPGDVGLALIRAMFFSFRYFY